MMSKHYLAAAVALASLSVAGVARATTDTLNLTGTVADSVFGTVTSGGVTYSEWMLPLSGLDSTNSLTFSQGDEFEGTINLDAKFSVTIPTSGDLTLSALFLTGTIPLGNTQTLGVTTFFNDGIKVTGYESQVTDTNAVVLGGALGDNQTITFNSIGLNYSINELTGPATMTKATFYLFVPGGSFGSGGGGGGGGGVPEPAAWSLMLLGFGTVGAAMRLRGRHPLARTV